jgi:L-fucose mutarotase
MLIGIPSVIGPELLAVLSRMGHGDELVLADAHFPGESIAQRLLRCDGVRIAPLLDGICRLFPLDAYVSEPVVMMAAVPGDTLDPAVEAGYRQAIERWQPGRARIQRLERFAFYERTRGAFAVVMTGELAKYGNVILKKGLVEGTA